MSTDVKCPNCGHQFPMEEAVSEEYKKELREKMAIYIKQKDEEFLKKEKEFTKKSEEEKIALQRSVEETLRKSITGDFENQLRLLQESNKDNKEKLK